MNAAGMPASIVRPARLRRGDIIGVCSPSFPAHVHFREKYMHGVRELEACGFGVVEGALTRAATAQGYRTGSPQARADELMGLFENASVRAIITTIGGATSASLIPYLDGASGIPVGRTGTPGWPRRSLSA